MERTYDPHFYLVGGGSLSLESVDSHVPSQETVNVLVV